MILVDGLPIIRQMAGVDAEILLLKLLRHPSLVKSALAFTSTPLRTFKAPSPSGNNTYDPTVVPNLEAMTTPNFVYIFQREYATVDLSLAQMVGTDDLTTCIALAMRDPATGRTGLGHYDSVQSIARGIDQLVNSVVTPGCGIIQVHMMGAFDDSSEYANVLNYQNPFRNAGAVGLLHEDLRRHRGYSWPLAMRMINLLQSSVFNFEIVTCCILNHLTVLGSHGHPVPVVRGCMVETATGAFFPANFEVDARGPDGVVRQACCSMQHTASDYKEPELLSPYITNTDTFSVTPTKWDVKFCLKEIPYFFSLSDEQLLLKYSTSPYAEGSNFLPSSRSVFQYLMQFPRWEETFPAGLPRVFTRSSLGGWKHFIQGSI